MEEQKKSRLMEFTTAAKHIIFDAERFKQFLPMLDTGDGAIKAVQTVIAVIETKYPVPQDIAPLLAMNIYLLMVDMAQEILGVKPDSRTVMDTMSAVMKAAFDTEPLPGNEQQPQLPGAQPPQPQLPGAQPPQPQPAAPPPAGLIGA